MSSWNFWQMFATCPAWVVFRSPWCVQGMSEDEVDAIRQESGLPGFGDGGKRRGRFYCLVGLPGGSPDTAEGGGRWKSGISAAQKDRRRGTAEKFDLRDLELRSCISFLNESRKKVDEVRGTQFEVDPGIRPDPRGWKGDQPDPARVWMLCAMKQRRRCWRRHEMVLWRRAHGQVHVI